MKRIRTAGATVSGEKPINGDAPIMMHSTKAEVARTSASISKVFWMIAFIIFGKRAVIDRGTFRVIAAGVYPINVDWLVISSMFLLASSLPDREKPRKRTLQTVSQSRTRAFTMDDCEAVHDAANTQEGTNNNVPEILISLSLTGTFIMLYA